LPPQAASPSLGKEGVTLAIPQNDTLGVISTDLKKLSFQRQFDGNAEILVLEGLHHEPVGTGCLCPLQSGTLRVRGAIDHRAIESLFYHLRCLDAIDIPPYVDIH